MLHVSHISGSKPSSSTQSLFGSSIFKREPIRRIRSEELKQLLSDSGQTERLCREIHSQINNYHLKQCVMRRYSIRFKE